MRTSWSPEELIDCWTLVEDNWRLVGNKTGATRLGFSVMLKHFELEGRFPEQAAEIPQVVVDYMATQVKVDSSRFPKYDWPGRTGRYHRAQIRKAFGFRECTEADLEDLASWLAEEVCPVELSRDRLREALAAHCRAERLEPPASGQVGRVVGSGVRGFEESFCQRALSAVPEDAARRLEELVADDQVAGDPAVVGGEKLSLLAELKADPGEIGLETFLSEVDKLDRVRALALPEDLFAHVSERVATAWRDCAAKAYPSDLRASPRAVRLTLLAAFC